LLFCLKLVNIKKDEKKYKNNNFMKGLDMSSTCNCNFSSSCNFKIGSDTNGEKPHFEETNIAILRNNENLASPRVAKELIIYSTKDKNLSELCCFDLIFKTSGKKESELIIFQNRLASISRLAKDNNCRIIVGLDEPGGAYGILSYKGFHICTLDPKESSDLKSITIKIKTYIGSVSKTNLCNVYEKILPKELSKGYYFLDLEASKKLDPKFTSRGSILTFLENTPFISLQIRASHTPKWLNSFITLAKLKLEVTSLKEGLTLEISHLPGRPENELLGQNFLMSESCTCSG
jgi:hypothetical protein